MLPIGDHNPTRTTPFVNYLLLAMNVLAFVWQYILMAAGGEAWVVPGYGLVPTRLTNDPLGEAFTLFTSMFMHGGWGHLGGNMLYLYIFGDNVEDAMGHTRYLLYYLACGAAAGLVQVAIGPSSTIPMVGASGAIAGVLGGYMVLYPRAPITLLNPIPLLWLFLGFFIVLPAWVVTGMWFIWNLMSGVGQLGQSEGGGVAFFAHVGGFAAGMLMVRAVVAGRKPRDRGQWSGWRPPPGSGRAWSDRSPRSGW
ncbi:MAG TPA: rhomboid family intramembrane serine protease [Polyangiaceae bacterium]|nr:rhomboid family intramembrane serine protease [Polyangiaceae bacterium]